MAKLIALAFMLVMLGIFIFGALVYPIWILINCATNQQRSTKSKTIWIIFMIVAWPLTSYLYGLFASKRTLFKWFSSILIVLLALLIFVFFASTAYLNKYTASLIASDISKITSNQIGGLTDEEIQSLKANMETLQNELKGGVLKADKKFTIYNLTRMFEIISADNKINQSELTDWMDKFESRDTLDRNAFEKYVDDLAGDRQTTK